MDILKKIRPANIFLVLSLMAIQSCALASRPIYELPYAYDENASPMWKLGWNHGCQSGFTVYGSNYHRTMYKFTQEVDRMSDRDYYRAWLDSFNYCRHYINRYLAGESFSYEESPTLISSSSLNIRGGDKRDNRALTATGIFSSKKTSDGLFSSMFKVNTPGHGDTAWGANVKKCDWLNRCGKDQPADWHW